MFRFTLRDLMWLTALTGFLVHAWIEKSQTVGERNMKRRMNEALAQRDDIDRELEATRARLQDRLANAEQRAARHARAASQMHVELTEARIEAWVSSPNPNAPPAKTALYNNR